MVYALRQQHIYIKRPRQFHGEHQLINLILLMIYFQVHIPIRCIKLDFIYLLQQRTQDLLQWIFSKIKIIKDRNTFTDLSDDSGGRSVFSQTFTEPVIMGVGAVTNLRIISFISSVGFLALNRASLQVDYGIVKVSATVLAANSLNVQITATNNRLGLAFIGYTILMIDIDKINSLGKYYLQSYMTSPQTITNDALLKFNIPGMYGPIYNLNCSIGLSEFYSHNYHAQNSIQGGYFVNTQGSSFTDVDFYSSPRQQSFTLQIFCYLEYDCPYNQVYINSTCNCTTGQVLAGNYCTTQLNCIDAFINQTGVVLCKSCGYGTKFNASANTCICTDILLASGCTNITYCTEVSYTSPTVGICIDCNTSFTLVNGRCVCGYNLRYNSTADLCVCVGNMIAGGCNQIIGCLQVSFLAWNQSQCILCNTSYYYLSNGTCKTIYNTTLASSSNNALDNLSLTIIVAVILTSLLFFIVGILYLCSNVTAINQALINLGLKSGGKPKVNSITDKYLPKESVQAKSHERQMNNFTQASIVYGNQSTEDINGNYNLKKKKRSKSKLSQVDVYGMQIDQIDLQ